MANVRWKDKADISTLAVDDYIPVTDKSAANTDKYCTPAEIATSVFAQGGTLGAKLTAGASEIEGNAFDINGGTVDAVTMGTNSPITNLIVDDVQINGQVISTTGSNKNIELTPHGTGKVNIASDLDMSSKDIGNVGDIGCANITVTSDVTTVNGIFTGGVSMASNVYLNCTPQSISGTGTVLAAVTRTSLRSGAGQATITMGDGNTDGQLHYIYFAIDGGGDVVISGGKLAFTSITFTTVGEGCTLMWDDTDDKWYCVGVAGTLA